MSQCIKCLQEELVEKIQDEAEAARALPVPAPEVASAGGTRRLATPIPSELVQLPRKLGLVTSKVLFLDDVSIASFATNASWDYGKIFVCTWDGTRDCTLPATSKSLCVFRIVFRMDHDGEILPVQQCVDVRREPACVLLASQFFDHARFVRGETLGSLPGPVQELLERTWTRSRAFNKEALQIKIAPLVERLCAPTFVPCRMGAMLHVKDADSAKFEAVLKQLVKA